LHPRRHIIPTMRPIRVVKASVAALGLMPLLTLAGCSALNSASSPAVTSAASVSGTIHGGQQPITGATIQLVAAGTTGYGSVGSVLASTSTDGNGRFTLNFSNCPASNPLVYLLGTGGNAGAGTNSSIAEAVVIGPCTSFASVAKVNITEVTTVAAAYALAPFAFAGNGLPGIGTSATNIQGLNNAAGAAANLANLVTGNARTTADLTGIVPPTAELNTLANILSACVNQGLPVANNNSCNTLFTATTPTGGLRPTDTFTAALDIALHPAANLTTLFGLATANAPYQPTLTAQPTDFSVALGFNGGAIASADGNGATAVAIDATGNAWITTGFDSIVHTLTEISPSGAYLSGSTVADTTGFGSTVLNQPAGVAIDQNGFVLVANYGNGNVLKFNPNGTLLTTLTSPNLVDANGIAIDASGNSWVTTKHVGGLVEFTANGLEQATSPYLTGFVGYDIAIDSKNVYESYPDDNSGFISRFSLATHTPGNPLRASTTTAMGLSIDHSDNLWFLDPGNGIVSYVTPAGGGNNGQPHSGTVFPQNLALDGLGNAFSGTYISQTSPGTLLEYSNTGTLLSPSNGYNASGVMPVLPLTPNGIAVDGSGNVWVTGTNNTSTLPNYVTEVIGIAAPVVTPLSVGVTNNTIATRP
jgi:hypothetical protein